jgi:hypothetical protein
MSIRYTFNIPSAPSEFDTFQKTIVPIIIAKAVLYGVPALTATHVAASKLKWDGYVLICDTDATKGPGATANRNDYQPTYSDELSVIIEDYLLNNDVVTPADRLSFHIHPLVGVKVALPAPTSTVAAIITYHEPLAHYFKFLDSVTGKKKKPKGVSFVELRYLIALVPPTSVNDCTESVFLNERKSRVLFTSADVGKKAYYFGRYVNKNGDFGPWCALFSAGII